MNDDVNGELKQALGDFAAPEHRPGYFENVEEGLAASRWSRERRPRRRAVWMTAAAAAAAAAIVLVSLFGLPGTGEKAGPQSATAADMVALMATGPAGVRSVSGTLTQTTRSAAGEYSTQGPFAVTAAGDFRTDQTTVADTGPSDPSLFAEPGVTQWIEVYDAAAHAKREEVHFRNRPTGYSEASGPAALSYWLTWPGKWQVEAAWVRAALADGDLALPVASVSYEGRAAWKATIELGRYIVVEATVDRETGLVLSSRTTWKAGQSVVKGVPSLRLVSDMKITDLKVDPPLDRTQFSLEFPPGAHVDQYPAQQTLTLDQLRAQLGRAPYVPAWVPPGYKLTATTTWSGPPWILEYRRGLDTFVVVGSWYRNDVGVLSLSPGALSPPIAAQQTRLKTGPFAGSQALTFLGALTACPGLLVKSKTAGVVQLQGNLTRQESLQIANSLQPYKP